MESNFYGNITNTSRTQFQFDRIYDNRVNMEKNASHDGVFVGRYVLIEYNVWSKEDSFNAGYYQDNTKNYLELLKIDNKFYFIKKDENDIKHSSFEAYVADEDRDIGTILPGQICYVENPEGSEYKYTFYIAGKEFKELCSTNSLNNEESNYTYNWNEDYKEYGRGYDSTVWQKIYIDNVEKYIMIAELNASVPHLDVSTDAPNEIPGEVHVEKINDQEYNFHLQGSWGFRVKEAQENEPSDEITIHKIGSYSNGIWNEKDGEPIPAAIYYNKDAFSNFGFERINYVEKYEKEKFYYYDENKYTVITELPENTTIKQKYYYKNENNGEYYTVIFLEANEYFWNEQAANDSFYYFSDIKSTVGISNLTFSDEIYDYFIKDNLSYIHVENPTEDEFNKGIYFYAEYKSSKDESWDPNKTYYIKRVNSNNSNYYYYDVISIVGEKQPDPIEANDTKVRYENGKYFQKEPPGYYLDDSETQREDTNYYFDEEGKELVTFKDYYEPYVYYLKTEIYKDENGIYKNLDKEPYEGQEVIYTDVYVEDVQTMQKYNRYYLDTYTGFEILLYENEECLDDSIHNIGWEQIEDVDTLKVILDGNEYECKISYFEGNEAIPALKKIKEENVFEIQFCEDPNYEFFNVIYFFDKVQTEKRSISIYKDEPRNNIIHYQKIIGKKVDQLDLIKIEGTGISGKEYNHGERKDIQELTIQLPSIGNTISELYDILYGAKRNMLLYSSPYKDERMFDHKGNPLYNTDEKSLLGLMNRAYNLIGHNAIKINYPDVQSNISNIINKYGEGNALYYNEYDNQYYKLSYQAIVDEEEKTWTIEPFAKPEEIETMMGIINKIESIFNGQFDLLLKDFQESTQFLTNEPISASSIIIEGNENGTGSKIFYNINHNENKNGIENSTVIQGVTYDGKSPQININDIAYDKWGHINDYSNNKLYNLPQAIITYKDTNLNELNIPIGTFTYVLDEELNIPEDENPDIPENGGNTDSGTETPDDTNTFTVTYQYVDSDGNIIKDDTVDSVNAGAELDFTTEDSRAIIEGYTCISVDPISVTINEDTIVTYTYTVNEEQNKVKVTVSINNGAKISNGSELTTGEQEVTKDKEYLLKVELTNPDGSFSFSWIIIQDANGEELVKESITSGDSFEYKYIPVEDCFIQITTSSDK